MNWIETGWQLIRTTWLEALVGSLLMLAGVPVGFALARNRRLPPVRWINAWVTLVAWPIVQSGRWTHRFVGILVNNTTVLVMLVFLGKWRWACLLGTVALGASLGIGLRLIAAKAIPGPAANHDTENHDFAWRIGLWLNLLEPPAIALAIGLSLARSSAGPFAAPGPAWNAFVAYILPLLILAAAGEALWLGYAGNRDSE